MAQHQHCHQTHEARTDGDDCHSESHSAACDGHENHDHATHGDHADECRDAETGQG
ncbi:hypothetical protein ACH4Q6_34455 [Streptomyces lydicus]|uniref:hypothetical protein n=1 Tax=Streptomyces lydicus TaxID=47763 RepID=UPI00379BF5B6